MSRHTRLITFCLICFIVVLSQDSLAQNWRQMISRADSLAESGDPAKLDSGIVLTRQILDLAIKDVGKLDSTAIVVLQLLGVYLTYRGDYFEADSIFGEVYDLSMITYGERDVIAVRTLNNRAVMMQYTGFYDSSLVLQRKALDLTKKYRGTEHTDVALGLNNMAMNFASLGMQEEREAALKQARDIWRNAYGDSNKYSAIAINNLGDLSFEQGKLEQAEEYYKTAMAMRRASHDTSSTNWIDSYLALSKIQMQKSNLDSAGTLCNTALRVAVRVLADSDPYFITVNEQLAHIAFRQSKIDEAKRLYLQCIEDRPSRLGPDQPDAPWDQLALIYRLQGKPHNAFSSYQRAFTTKWRSYQLNSHRLTEREALSYFQKCRNAASGAVSAYFEIPKPDTNVTRELAEILLTCKGSVSDQVFRRHREQFAISDPTTKSIALALREKRSQYSELYYGIASPIEQVAKAHRLDSLSRLCADLERQLAVLGATPKSPTNAESITVDEVSKELPPDACLIEYFRYDYQSPQASAKTPQYLALALRFDSEPLIVPLGTADSLDRLVLEYQSHMESIVKRRTSPGRTDLQAFESISSGLFSTLLEPVITMDSTIRSLIISPEGSLNSVSYGTIKDKSNRYLVERFAIDYVTAGRDLVKSQDAGTEVTGLLAVGDPDFDASPSDKTHRLANTESGRYSPVSAYTYNQRSVCDQFYTRAIQRIPSTAEEIKKISDEWNRNNGPKAVVLSGAEASEANFKAYAPGKSLLYLATHGYFLKGGCDRSFAGEPEVLVSENPLLLGGLILAGANKRGFNKEATSTEDGILTADEVSMLDLRGTELVVLSACESGIGRVEVGEGVYGLRRAFQMAGARSVISALWKIDDKSTSEMMTPLLNNGNKSLSSRLRQMQLQQIQRLRNEGRTDHPYTWGAFVLTGN